MPNPDTANLDKMNGISTFDEAFSEVLKKCDAITNYKTTKENNDMRDYFSEGVAFKSPTPEQSTINALEAFAKESPENPRLMKQVAEKTEHAHRQRVQKALEGSAELELIKGPQGKRFVLKHFLNGREYTAYGTVYPGYDADDESANTNATVFLQADNHLCFHNNYRCMARFKKSLEDLEAPYVIKFFD